MSLFPAPRRLCAPSLVPLMASLVLASGLASPPAHAGSYTDTQSGGTSPAVITPAADATGRLSASASMSSRGGNMGGPTYTIQMNPGTITDTFNWVPDSGQTSTTDPPPSCVLVWQTSGATWYVRSEYGTGTGTGTADCGLKGAAVTPGTYNAPFPSQSPSATLYSQQSGASFSVSCSPTVSFTGTTGTEGSVSGAVMFSGGATVFPVTLNVGGTKPDSSGNPNILVGQQCTATVVVGTNQNGASFPGTLSNFRWSVSGTTFENWGVVSDANNQSHTAEVDGYGPATNSTASWYWNDLKQATETVTCTATVTPPTGQGAPFPITVTQKVTVYTPASTGNVLAGYMQVNMTNPNDTTHYDLWAGGTSASKAQGFAAGMNFRATVTTPSTPAFGPGSLEMVQLVTPNNTATTVANPRVPINDPQQGILCLDGTYPYGNVSSEVAAPAATYLDNDSPGVPLNGTSLYATATKSSSYNDFLMYKPAGNNSTWVVLSTFNWSTTGSATIPTGNDWALYATQNGGSDSAGTVNTPQGTSFTPVTTPNTFPKWSHVAALKGH